MDDVRSLPGAARGVAGPGREPARADPPRVSARAAAADDAEVEARAVRPRAERVEQAPLGGLEAHHELGARAADDRDAHLQPRVEREAGDAQAPAQERPDE